MAETNTGYDAKAWLDRLVDLAKGSKFSASERAFITQRLIELRADVAKPIPFVEAR